MNVLGIGESVIDTTRVIRHRANATMEVIDSYQDAGGPVVSALILLARLGHTCTIMTSLGNDIGGQLIRSRLQQEGIQLINNPQAATKKHTIIVDAHTGKRHKLRDTATHTPIPDVSKKVLEHVDLIVMDRHEPAAFHDVITHKSPHAKVITDPSTEVSVHTLAMLRHSTCPIIPIESLATLAPDKTLHMALKQLSGLCRKTFVVTLGELGSLLYDGKQIEIIVPTAVDSIDSNGAGDVYRGAFAHALSRGESLAASARYANTVAALQCTKHGNAQAIPTKKAIAQHIFYASCRSITLSEVEEYFMRLTQHTTLPVHQIAGDLA